MEQGGSSKSTTQSGTKLTRIVCKCCKKKFKSNRILHHLNSHTKLNCISKYSEDELNSLKQESKKRSANLRKKWKIKNKTYYASQRAAHYEINKYKLSKQSAEYYATNKEKVLKRQSQYYLKRKAREDQELAQRKEELEQEYELRKIKADMPKFKDWQTERVKYYLDLNKWSLTKDWNDRWEKNLENFSKKGIDIYNDERVKSLPKLNDYCSEMKQDLSCVVEEVKSESIVDYDWVEEQFQNLIDKLDQEKRNFQMKIATTMREIGVEVGIKVICGLHASQDYYTKKECFLCKDGFFKMERNDKSSKPYTTENKEYIRKRRPINFTMENLDSDSEEDPEFKSKDACADAPRMNDRNLRRPYNFRTPKKYAYHHETSKTAALELEINCD